MLHAILKEMLSSAQVGLRITEIRANGNNNNNTITTIKMGTANQECDECPLKNLCRCVYPLSPKCMNAISTYGCKLRQQAAVLENGEFCTVYRSTALPEPQLWYVGGLLSKCVYGFARQQRVSSCDWMMLSLF